MKVIGPGFSLDASGSLGGAIVASKWKGRNYFRVKVTPSNPKTALQTSMRSMWKFTSQNWAAISSVDQVTWQAKADQLVAAPFNAYMQQNQFRWRNFTTPTKAFPAAAVGTAGVVANEVALPGVRSITVEWDILTLNENWGVIIHRSDTALFSPTISTVLAVVLSDTAGGFKYVDSPLDPGEYFYQIQPFTDDGVTAPPNLDFSAIVV